MEREEYHLALQGGCHSSSLMFAICFSLLGREMWSPFSGPVFGDGTLSFHVPVPQGECSQLDHFWLPPERASLTTDWPNQFQRERASVESFSRACASVCSQATPFGRRIRSLLPLTVLVWGYGVGFLARQERYICLYKRMQVRGVTHSSGRESPAPCLPTGNTPAERRLLPCLLLPFPCPDSLVLHSAAGPHV